MGLELEVNGSEAGEGGLGILLRKGCIYPARYKRPGKLSSSHDNKIDPEVAIIDPSNPSDPPYYGFVCYSLEKDPTRRLMANDIRNRLIDEGPNVGLINVRVIGIPRKGIRGPYPVIGVSYDISMHEAFDVLIGENVFYARFVDFNKFGELVMRFYTKDEVRRCGYLRESEITSCSSFEGEDKQNVKRGYANRTITSNIVKNAKLGDYILVRQIGRDNLVFFLEPVINFLPNEAKSPNGRGLLTIVRAYTPKSMIWDLPIVEIKSEISRPNSKFGVGYVVRPQGEEKTFYYKPVWVFGAKEEYRGKYVTAEILTNGHGIIRARKVS